MIDNDVEYDLVLDSDDEDVYDNANWNFETESENDCDDIDEDKDDGDYVDESSFVSSDVSSYSLDQMKKIVEMKQNNCSFHTIQHRFKKIRYPSQINRLVNYLFYAPNKINLQNYTICGFKW